VIVDSLAPACGPEPETADAAVRTMAALRSFGTTNLVLAHVSKATADAPGPARPFGSVFVRNLARVLWEIRRESDDADGLRLACYQRKNNLGPVAPSFGLHCVFTEQAITLTALDLANAPDLLERATLWQRIVVALKTSDLTVEELALGLSAKATAVRKALERHRCYVAPLANTSPAKWRLNRD